MEDNKILIGEIDVLFNDAANLLQKGQLLPDSHDAYASIQEIANRYQDLMGREIRKKSGSFYTDRNIVVYMVDKVFRDIDIVKNPYIRILDPSCGSGYFLLEAYYILRNKFLENLNSIREIYPELHLSVENIDEHIVKHNIFGADIDMYAVKLTIVGIMLKSRSSTIPNIICCDSIINYEKTIFEQHNFWKQDFDIIIGNPPYIGHKKMTGEYRKALNRIYGDIFRDKADISFCFIKSSIDRLAPGGGMCFITSRYFMESPSGKALRRYICKESTIDSIVDFYGVRIMKGISVDPAIIYIKKMVPGVQSGIDIFKARLELKKVNIEKILSNNIMHDSTYYENFEVHQCCLSADGWVLLSNRESNIIQKIEDQLNLKLSDVCTSFQGIITGCDKAFILDEHQINKSNIERDIVKRWIKNSNINKYSVDTGILHIIYSDLIDDLNAYPNSIKHIEKFRDRLEKRRECIKGSRKWYHLQWGRDSRLFDMKKIVFPYKSHCSRFAIDQGSYSSADVYGMILKDKYKTYITYEFLVGILNSKLYEFYFKSIGKKLGDNLYDYYPNTVMRLKVPGIKHSFIETRVLEILSFNDKSSIAGIRQDIDNYIFDMFGLTADEIKLVEERTKTV